MPPQNQPSNNVQTIAITNFGGRLTRKLNGDLNSGFAKFSSSWGYDPFSKPDNLTWLPASKSITGNITDLILDGKLRFESDFITYLYAVGNSGALYKIQPVSQGNNDLNTASVIGKIAANSPTFKFGASMEIAGTPNSVLGIYVGSDTQVNSVNFDGSGDVKIGSAGYLGNTYRPLKKFAGYLFFGNGNTVGKIDPSLGAVTSSVIGTGVGNLYSELNPSLSADKRVHDLSVSVDGNYLNMAVSGVTYESVADVNYNLFGTNISKGEVASYNGSDQTVTATTSLGESPVSALKSYLGSNLMFSSDTFGTSVGDGTNKILTLPNNKAPLPNAVSVNSNFITWGCVEIDQVNRMCASIYYFGSLDQENPPGLYRIARIYPVNGVNGFMYQVPFNTVVSANSRTLNSSKSSVMTAGYGKHYFSTLELTSTSSVVGLQELTVSGDTTSNVQAGTYETQTQIFSKKISVKQIRVYTEPTVANSGIEIDFIGSDGTVMTNGTYQYVYTAGTDITKLQGSLERIDFNPTMKDTYALGIRIVNNGNTNMTVKKIEIDYVVSGK